MIEQSLGIVKEVRISEKLVADDFDEVVDLLHAVSHLVLFLVELSLSVFKFVQLVNCSELSLSHLSLEASQNCVGDTSVVIGVDSFDLWTGDNERLEGVKHFELVLESEELQVHCGLQLELNVLSVGLDLLVGLGNLGNEEIEKYDDVEEELAPRNKYYCDCSVWIIGV